MTMEKEKGIFTLEMFGQSQDVRLDYTSYSCNGTLALQLMCKSEVAEACFPMQDGRFVGNPYIETYGIATVNLPESERLAVNAQFVDGNNLPGIGRWLEENGIAKPLDIVARSGWCTYMAYEFEVPEQALSNIRNAREDIIAARLVERIGSSGLKPAERTARGDRYHIAEGTDIVLYRGGTDGTLGAKPDVFLLAGNGRHVDRDMWRLRNLPHDVRQALADDIMKALTERAKSNRRTR